MWRKLIQNKYRESFSLCIKKVFDYLISDGTSHKTKKYGDVDSTSIRWNSPVEFLYTAQPSFKF
jgi:hypothetical protein